MYPTGGVGSARLGGEANSCGRSSGRSSDILSIWFAGAIRTSLYHNASVSRPFRLGGRFCRKSAVPPSPAGGHRPSSPPVGEGGSEMVALRPSMTSLTACAAASGIWPSRRHRQCGDDPRRRLSDANPP